MAKIVYNQTDFTAGELSPRMKGRGDVERYQKGADIIENGIVVVQGGVKRRNGLRYCAETKFGGTKKSRLIRYIYSVDQSYMLEFGDLYFRVFDGVTGAVILNSGLTTLEVVTPYTESQLAEIVTKQNADTMYLFHKDVPTQILKRLTATLWVITPAVWIVEPFTELGHIPDTKVTLSLATVGTGRTFTTSAVTVAGAPTIGTATPLNGSARVTFTAPASNGGSPIDYYTVTSAPGGFTATGAASPITVSGLTNGVVYTFTVTAHNVMGNSAASAATAGIIPLSSLGGGTITATVTPSPFYASAFNGLRTVLGPTATGTSGTGPYTYLWTKLSGDTNISVSTATTAQVVLSSTAYGAENFISLQCVVSDSLGAIGTVLVNAYVDHAGTPGGGGGGGGGGGYVP